MPSQPVLRTADQNDTDAIRTLTRAAYAKWLPISGREPLPMQADYSAALKKHRIDLLYVGPDLAGLIEMNLQEPVALIENVAVHPDFQGQGLGRFLLAHGEVIAAAHGSARIRLFTNKLFTDNLRLYQKTGYTVDGEEEMNGAIAVHMSKTLTR
ncbi:GCN5-like N-acetyltransferase [Tepidicaulis marinus]|uniref:GCN5-like N-acetyltransferase n=1 Tax=Tepidicaulis marinus TaxID=1333998 RepID=A0A081B6U9_9HYPH|nr:GNAT family N-acetyltransferase [Tepidicaulis marinus]GAK43767.1 GCN5-like N-acetyltransferase [Tepidicaulis marinus]